MRQVYHAVMVTGFKTAELIERPSDDAPPSPTEITGATVASLISPGTELAYAYTSDTIQHPAAVGYSAVFVVDGVGADVNGFACGDLVFCMGPHSSRQRASADHCIAVPAGLSPQIAVFARLMGVSMSTLATTAARPPERVAITGLGPVGFLAAAIFSSCGYEVLTIEPDQHRREFAARLPGVAVVATMSGAPKGWVGNIRLVLECSGHEQAALEGCNAVDKGGEVVLVGCPWRRNTDIHAHALLTAIFHKYVVLRSGWEWELPLLPAPFRSASILGNQAAALRWLSENRVDVEGTATLTSPADCQTAYQNLLNKRTASLATVFDWTAIGP